MAYIEGLNCFVSFFEKGVKLKCARCGLIKVDGRPVTSKAKPLEFGEIKTTVRCPNCDNDTFVLSANFEPYIEDTIMEIHEEQRVNNSVEDDDEYEQDMDNVSE